MSMEEWLLEHSRVADKQHAKITLDDKVSFFQQLSTLVSAGTPLLEATRICSQQTQSTRLQEILEDIAASIAGGGSLHGAMAEYDHVFSHHWIAVVQTGEASGRIGPVLMQLNDQIREYRETTRKLIGALMYPAVLIVVSIVVITLLLWVVVPTFAGMFADMGAKLPGITQFVVSLSDGIVAYGPFVLLGIVALAFLIRQQLRTDSGRYRFGVVGMAIPVVGDLMVQSSMYRFSTNLALLLNSGVPILDALATIRSVFQTSPLYRLAVESVEGNVMAGQSLADSLQETGLFPSMMVDLTRTGEESGQLSAVMEQVAPYYKEKMNGFISKLTKLVEPVIIAFMGVTIAVVMTSIYLPMFEMAGNVS